MNKAVELITAWGAFDAQHPKSSIEEFCRHYLTHKRENVKEVKLKTGGLLPPTIDGLLMRLMGRIMKLHSIYTIAATEGTGINTVEEFSLLNIIFQLNEPRKTEAIYAGLYELSTGTDMLNRLKKLGYISEYNDTEDKRSKRLKVTGKGEKVMTICRKRVIQLAEMMLYDLSEDDKLLCFQLLQSIETKFTGIWQSHKGKNFEDIYKEIVAEMSATKKKGS